MQPSRIEKLENQAVPKQEGPLYADLIADDTYRLADGQEVSGAELEELTKKRNTASWAPETIGVDLRPAEALTKLAAVLRYDSEININIYDADAWTDEDREALLDWIVSGTETDNTKAGEVAAKIGREDARFNEVKRIYKNDLQDNETNHASD